MKRQKPVDSVAFCDLLLVKCSIQLFLLTCKIWHKKVVNNKVVWGIQLHLSLPILCIIFPLQAQYFFIRLINYEAKTERFLPVCI